MMKKKREEAPPCWLETAVSVADENDADIYLYSGGIYPPFDREEI